MSTNDQVERAKRIHDQIPPHLRGSPIILRAPGIIPEPRRLLSPVGVETHVTDLEWLIKNVVTPNDEWTKNPHHELLLKLIDEAQLPEDRGQDTSMWAKSLDRAHRLARLVGYSIPEEWDGDSQPSDGENEAFWAARSVAESGRIESPGSQRGEYRAYVCTLVSNFPVPNANRNCAPYFLDLLWVVLQPGATVRLMAIEVDGPQHLQPEKQASDRARDAHLAELGYEIWRVAGWWCGVDAWRAVTEVLVRANLLSPETARFREPFLTDIASYVCDVCGKPMVRYDKDWIQHWFEREEGAESDSLLKAHECCHPES